MAMDNANNIDEVSSFDLLISDEALLQTLPDKSQHRYLQTYDKFMNWQKTNNTNSFDEDILLAYFADLLKTLAPSTLWTIYSMLKSIINNKHNVDISRYTRLLAFVRQENQGYVRKKTNIFTADEMQKFLTEAPDSEYLTTKVASLFVMCGVGSGDKLTTINMEHVQDHETEILVRVPDSETNMSRVCQINNQFAHIVRKYMRLRPPFISTNRFFIQHLNRRCTSQHIGKNTIAKMPQKVAEYLGLPDPAQYTGCSWRKIGTKTVAETVFRFDSLTKSNSASTSSQNSQDTVLQPATANNYSPNLRIKQEDDKEFNASEYILSDSHHYTTPHSHDIQIKTEDYALMYDDIESQDSSSSSNPNKKFKYSVDNGDIPEMDARQTLPDKSQYRYLQAYEKFMNWQKTNNTNSFDEDILLAYFADLAKTFAPSTLWTIYSMLKSIINNKHNVDISRYTRLLAFVRQENKGYVGKKTNIFRADEMQKFLTEAPDSEYLAAKVVSLFAMTGVVSGEKLVNITMEHVKDYGSEIVVQIPDAETNVTRVCQIGGEFADIVRNYMRLRPSTIATDRFFIQQRYGKCTVQHIGKNTMNNVPRKVAEYLGLTNPEAYTRTSFRNFTPKLISQKTRSDFVNTSQNIVLPSATSPNRSPNLSIMHKNDQELEAGECVPSYTKKSTTSYDIRSEAMDSDSMPSESSSHGFHIKIEDKDIKCSAGNASSACQNSSLCRQKIKAQSDEIARLKQFIERQNSKIESLELMLLDNLQSKFNS